MNTTYSREIVPMVFSMCAALLVTSLFWFRSYTGLTRRQALLAILGSVIACGYRAHLQLAGNFSGQQQILVQRHDSEMEMYLAAFGSGALIVFLAALVIRLWGRWVGENATAEERQPGVAGIRAWFCSSNVIVGIMIVVCAWFGYDISPLPTTVGIAALLAACPLLRMESPAAAPVPAPEDMSAEREKIVSMLEAGKLTADESAELLQALGASKQQMPPRQVALTGGQRFMLLGAALVTVGFFLPWIVINPGQEISRAMSQVRLPPGYPPGYEPGKTLPPGYPPGYDGGVIRQLKTLSISASGGDIPRGLGWAALALALTAALLPYFAVSLDAATARTVRLLCLGIGTLIVLYLVTDNFRLVGTGLMVVVAGYALEIAGMLRDGRKAV